MEEITQKIKLLKINMPCRTYNVEIIDNGEETEFWLYNQRYGVKSLMFGLCETNMENDKILEIIDNNIVDYIKSYQEDYEKE